MSLTRPPPDTLSPHALDAAVAELMGWRIYHNHGNGQVYTIDWRADTDCIVYHAEDGSVQVVRALINGLQRPFKPSENIIDALILLDHWTGDYELTRRNCMAYRCELFQPSQQWDAWGETLPLAICRCAIAAAAEFPTKGATP